MDFIKVVLISLVLLISKNSSAQPEDHTTDQNEVDKCSSDKKVCGTDGKTYSNICLLQKETGVKLAHEGDCTRGGKKKSAYRPDLILKSKIVNNTEESLQKKLVKHFNPTTGKWEYVVEILPTIVITPTFHHLQMTNDDQEPSSYNVNNINTNADLKTDAAINAPTTELDVNKLPSTYFGKTAGEIFPKNKLIISDSQGPFNRNDNIITEIVGNVTNDSPRSQVDNGVLVPIKNETILPFNTSVSHPNRSHPSVFEPIKNETIIPSFNINVTHPNRLHPSVFPTRETSKIPGQKSLVRRFQTGLNKQKYFSKVFGPIKNVTIPSSNTSESHPNRSHPSVFEPVKNVTILSSDTSVSHPNLSHPSVFPSQEMSTITGEKSPDHQSQTVVHKPKSLDLRFVVKKKWPKRKHLPVHRKNHTHSQKVKPRDHTVQEKPDNKKITPKPVDLLPAVSSLKQLNLTGSLKDALQKSGNHSNEMQPRKNQTLPEKPVVDNVTDFRLNGSSGRHINDMPITLHDNATKTPAGNNSSQMLNSELKNYPKTTKKNLRAAFPFHELHHNKPLLAEPRVALYLDSNRHKLGQKENNTFKPPIGNVSSPHSTAKDNVLELNTYQRTTGNIGQPKEDQPVKNVSHSNGKVTATPARNGRHGTAVNIFPPASGNHSIPKVNITKNRTHAPHHFGPHFAVGVSKPHDWALPFIIENQKKIKPTSTKQENQPNKKNITQTKSNIDTKPESNTKWGTYYIKLPGNVSDNIDLVINWEVLPLNTYQPNLTINVSESIGSKNYTWPKVSTYITDTSAYHKLRSGSLKPINQKIHHVVNDDVLHNNNSGHPQFLVNITTTGDIPINVTKTLEIKTYQLEDEVGLKENVNPPSQVISKKLGHDVEKHGRYSLDLPSNVAGNFKLIFTWALKNKLPETIRSPIDVTEKEVKYDYKWKMGGNNKEEKPIGNEEIQPIRSVNVTTHKTVTPTKHSFGERRLTGRQGPGRRLHDLTQGLGNVHLDIPKSTTKPQLNTSAPVGTEEIRPAGSKLYPGWYYMEMLFNVPGGSVDGAGSADSNNCTDQNNYNDDSNKSNGPDRKITIHKSLPVLVTNESSYFF